MCIRDRKIVFLDELPWMDTPRSNFLSAFEHFWNGWASARKDIVLIICGSATSWKMCIRDRYEDSVIYGFTHTNKGHWNLCHIPLLPVTGTPLPGDYCSPYSHARESAAPGYYRVFLDRYGVDAELTSTLRCAFHKYTYPAGAQAALLADLQRSNEHVRAWDIRKEGDNAFAGWQQTGEKMYFYVVADRPVTGIEPVAEGDREIRIVRFGDGDGPVELRIGFSDVYKRQPVLGVNAPVIIGHGISSARAIKSMILSTEQCIKADLTVKLQHAFKN